MCLFLSKEHFRLHGENEAGPPRRSLKRRVGTITNSNKHKLKKTHKLAENWKHFWCISLNLEVGASAWFLLLLWWFGGYLAEHLMLLYRVRAHCRHRNLFWLPGIWYNGLILLGYQIWFNMLVVFLSLKAKVQTTIATLWQTVEWRSPLMKRRRLSPGSSWRVCPSSVHVRVVGPSSEPH